MTIPAFIFGSLIAFFFGAIFHVWRGGSLLLMFLFILSSVIGFWLGHLAALFWGVNLWNVGPIRFGPSIIGAVLFLFLARWLFQPTRN